MTFLLANWRLLILGSLLLVLGIQTWRLDRCKTAFHDYEVAVQALGQAQLAENERIAREREKAAKEVTDALKKQNQDLAGRYADARRRLRDDPGVSRVSVSGSAAPNTPALASACRPADGVAGDQAALSARITELEAALLDLMERADGDLARYRLLWEWSNRVP